MIEYQHTLKEAVSVEGIGLHTGAKTKLTLKPAAANNGYKFIRVDLEEQTVIKVDVKNVCSVARGTTIENNGAKVYTIEHLMAALRGAGVDNVDIEIDNVEVPILDGSSQPFIDAIEKVGKEKQDAERVYYKLDRTIRYFDAENRVELIGMPSDKFEVSTSIDFRSNVLGTGFSELKNLENFSEKIAPARTFCFLHELEELLKNDLIKGGSLENAIVFVDRELSEGERQRLSEKFNMPELEVKKKEGILNNVKLRFHNEPARHKLLDVIGDLTLVGVPIKAKIITTRPGHKANVAFAKMIREHMVKNRHRTGPVVDLSAPSLVDLREIFKILPHRYPMLLVDKIVKISEDEVIGIKNVTFNEGFFQGHFPGNPIMPGVLQIEALAQTGGILALKNVEDPENYLTYFLKIDKAKFRNQVVPGDVLVLKLKLVNPIRRGICEMEAKAYVGDRVVTEALLTAKIARKEDA